MKENSIPYQNPKMDLDIIMKQKMPTLLMIMMISSFALFGCKADEVEISIKRADLARAISGESVSARFEASLSLMAENTEETKQQFKRIEVIAEKYLSLEEFDVTVGDYGFGFSLEGELPIFYSPGGVTPKSVKAPWVMVISDNADGGSLSGFPYKLTLVTSAQFDAFSGEINNINMMLSPDKRQPLKLKLRNKGKMVLRIFTGGVEVGGESRAIYESNIEKRTTLTMKGGVYDNTPQVVYFSLK